MKTEFALLAVYDRPLIPLKEFVVKEMGIALATARNQISAGTFPVKVTRIAGRPEAGYAVTMQTDKFRYIFTFTEEERRQIRQEERRQQWQPVLAVVAGILTAVATFAVQLPWAGQPHLIHAYATWLAVPAGIAAGTTAYRWMMWRQYRRWMSRWWSLAWQRNQPRGWSTPPPERPVTLLDLTDRYIVHLNQAGATALAVVACYLALAICGPALLTTQVGEIAFEVWLFAGWLVAALTVDRHFHH